MPAIVIINRHEPEGEVASRLLDLADRKGYAAQVVEAQRGEHDAALSFRVPADVAETFEKERAKRWPVPEDAVTAEDNPQTPPVRTSRPGKAESN